jgi:hypothetical protein
LCGATRPGGFVPNLAHRDGRCFDGQPSLSGHYGHGPSFIAQRSVANDVVDDARSRHLVGMEACGTAHHWAREVSKLGHTVRLMPPSYVNGYVKRSKNDASGLSQTGR